MTGLTRRELGVRFTLDATLPAFDDTGSDVVDLTGLRVRASLVNTLSTTMDSLELEIWGMPLPVMNKLTILQNGYTQGIQNQVALTAGTPDAQALIFRGQVFTAWADFSGQPEGCFVVHAFSTLASAYAPVPALSFRGGVDAATVAGAIALAMSPPLTLQNFGVDVQLVDLNLPGDALAQLRRLAAMADFEWSTDEPGVLAIWPRGTERKIDAIDVNKDTGLVGFPSYNDKGVMFTTLFNPSLRVNAPVVIDSPLTPANGVWHPFTITHDLESQIPDGRWFSHCECQLLPEAQLP